MPSEARVTSPEILAILWWLITGEKPLCGKERGLLCDGHAIWVESSYIQLNCIKMRAMK